MNESQDALEQACATVGIDAGGARLLRVGSNAVYRLKPPVIVRVSRPGADPGQVRRTVAVARWLESAGYPAVRAVDVDQPVAVDGHLVTFWDAVSDDGDQYASTAESPNSWRNCTRSPPRTTCTCPTWRRSRTPRSGSRPILG